MADFSLIPGALENFLQTDGDALAALRGVGNNIRDEARRNASAITQKTDAIVSEMGADADGVYVDVGYAKRHPGFFLWWWEVGTRHHGPRPHLRPAVRPGLLD